MKFPNLYGMSDPELVLKGLLAGGGLYGSGRLLRDLLKNDASNKGPDDEELEITLPRSKVREFVKSSSVDKRGGWDIPGAIGGGLRGFGLGLGGDTMSAGYDALRNPLIAGVSAAAGYKGLSALYEQVQEARIESQLQSRKQRYLKKLEDLHEKKGSVSTPHTDGFCKGIASLVEEKVEMSKKAGYDEQGGDWLRNIARIPANIWNAPDRPTPSLPDAAKDIGNRAGKLFSGADPFRGEIGSTLLLTMLAAGSLPFVLGNRMEAKQKEVDDDHNKLPQRVKLKVV